MCIGNRDGGDDGIEPYIADTLKSDSLDFSVLDSERYRRITQRL
jgi:Ni,Fe-hydrogenase maturation factor